MVGYRVGSIKQLIKDPQVLRMRHMSWCSEDTGNSMKTRDVTIGICLYLRWYVTAAQVIEDNVAIGGKLTSKLEKVLHTKCAH